MDHPFGGFTQEALEAYQKALAEREGTDFAEGDLYDFTTCIRPDGSAYGTSGKCRKGSEGEARVAPVPPKSAMTSKDPVASALKGQKQLADLHKAENSRVADLVRAGKVKGVDPGAIERIQKRKLQDAASKGDPKAVKKLEEMEKAKPKAKPGKRKPRFSGPEEVENKLKAIGYNYDPKALLNGAWIRMDPKGRSSTIAVPKSKLVDWANANPGDLVVPSWMKKQK